MMDTATFDPYVVLGLILYLPFLVGAFVMLARADRWRRRWTLVALVLGLGISSWHFASTPLGVEKDSQITMGYLPGGPWLNMWSSYRGLAGQGWNVIPWWVFNKITGTYFGERVVGLVWHATLIVATGALVPRSGVPLALAVVATSPAILWLSRNAFGVEILVQQLYLMAALEILRERASRAASAVAGVCLGALWYTYPAARIAALYPALWLWRRPRRALAVYALALLVVVPQLWIDVADQLRFVGVGVPKMYRVDVWKDWVDFGRPAVQRSARSLWNDRVAQPTGTYGFGGAQTLPWSVMAVGAVGVAAGGWRYLPVFVASFLPDVVSIHGGGLSHRMMMIVMPTVFIVAQAGRIGPPLLVAAAAAVIAADSVARWVYLWDSHHSMGRYAYYPVSLFPCTEDPQRPPWCPQ